MCHHTLYGIINVGYEPDHDHKFWHYSRRHRGKYQFSTVDAHQGQFIPEFLTHIIAKNAMSDTRVRHLLITRTLMR